MRTHIISALVIGLSLVACASNGSDAGDDDAMGDDQGSGSDVQPPLACDEARVTWDAPIQNTDGTCLTDLGGFKLKWSLTMGGPYENVIDINLDSCMNTGAVECAEDGTTAETKECEAVIPALPQGTVYFVMTSYNLDGTESDPTGEVSKTVDCP
ncbi:MAG TPA: hypothetical protein VGM39_19045 [Kofleriaceae bacterium]|jgi:hypothetical protein